MATTIQKNVKPTLRQTAAAVTKNLLGVGAEAPKTVQMPQAVAELHVSPDDVIPAGAMITEEVAELAGLGDDDIERLIDQGHVKLVEVYASAFASDAAGS